MPYRRVPPRGPRSRSLFPEEPLRRPAPSMVAHIDGGARGNPGPAGYGVHITDAQGNTVAELSEYLGVRTNNYAEYSALLAALSYALDRKHSAVEVISDSELLVKQMLGEYKVRSPELKLLYDEARAMVRRLESFHIRHVRREQNREADRLANAAMDRGYPGLRGEEAK